MLLLLHGGDARRCAQHPALQRQAPWLERCWMRCSQPGLWGPCPELDWYSLDAMGVDGTLARDDAGFRAALAGLPPAPADVAARRVFKTHAPWPLFPCAEERLDPGTKIVFIARNPKDTCVSLFHHSTGIPAHRYSGDWAHFVDSIFLAGASEEGDWFEHTAGWWRAKHTRACGAQILWLFFEELKADPAREIRKVADFLGVDCDDATLERVVAESSFDAMKKGTEAAAPKGAAESTTRFRKGGAGGWRKMFTDEQSARVDAKYRAKILTLQPKLAFEFGE